MNKAKVNYKKMNSDFQKYDIVSFDVFDTLIIRNVVKPTDVFQLTGGKLFRCVRILAELLARKISNKEDITLDDIYRFLPKKYKQKEIATEFMVCKANPKAFPLYQEMKEQGKKLYAISDMYLPQNVIEKILKDCGYELDGVYVSSNVRLSKKTGNLFVHFIAENQIRPNDVIHIGDNEISDVFGAKKAGIDALCIEKTNNQLTYLSGCNDLYLKGFVNHKINDINDRCEQIGYEVLRPIIVSFCQWVNKKKTEYGFEKLFFLARDMKVVYEIYQNIYGDDEISYLHISRKSLHNSKENPEGLCEYLKKNSFYGNIAVVDTGWKCTTQPLLEHYAKKNNSTTDVGGLYMGATTPYNYISRSPNSGICFYNSRLKQVRAQTESALLEPLLGTNEPKTIGYRDDGSPLFSDDDKKIIGISNVQSGAYHFAADWLQESNNRMINPLDVLNSYVNLQKYPRMKDIDLIGECEYDNPHRERLVSYNEQNKNVKSWLLGLSYSTWKGGYFKKSFKHYKILYFFYNFFNAIYRSVLETRLLKQTDEYKIIKKRK